MSSPFTLPGSLTSLPIADVAEEVFLALQQGNVLLSAEPGAGKSTGLPLALLQAASTAQRIIMLEPRRLAAIGVAERLAAQLKEPLGQRIGLRMRGRTSVSKSTVLEVVTEGVLTRILQSDPTLENVALVIFDEFHERSLHADLGLALCLDIQRSIRENLKLLLMSATLNMGDFDKALGNVRKITSKGRQYPVDIQWFGSNNTTSAQSNQVTAAILQALKEHQGDILVFLPGVAEIDRVNRELSRSVSSDQVKIIRLHGRADKNDQREAVAARSELPVQLRRVILSTSIAETSITIDGVRVVIDSGLERRSRINIQTGAQQLETVSASQASATQRAGRAGRTAPGICYRLWSEHDHKRRARSWQPEILRADLSSLIVEMGLWGVTGADALPWIDAPPMVSLKRAETSLSRLGIWQDGRLTEHGRAVSNLPMHPRLGHMLLWAAKRGALARACKLAVLLEEGGRLNRVDVELLMQQRLNGNLQQRANQLERMLADRAQLDNGANDGAIPSVAVLIAQAFPEWIAQRRAGADARYSLALGSGALMRGDEPITQSLAIAIASMGGSNKEASIFLAAELNMDELVEWSPELVSQNRHIAWDVKQERVVAEQRRCVGKLVLNSHAISDLSAEETVQAVLDGIRQRGILCLPWTEECRQWQCRVKLMASLSSTESQDDWPAVDDASLLDSVNEWLAVWLNGIRSLKALSQLNLLAVLQNRLTYQQQQTLDKLLPVRFTVPSGSNIKLQYSENNEPPVLSVKLQEMFGCQENPAIAQGRLALKVELLSPARRPVQITTDLANFWTNSYPAVKKDMAGRYPKHDWPDDPLLAKPTAFAKRKRKN